MRLVMLLLACLLLQSGVAGLARAETRAELDRDRIALGESVTLSIETDQMTAIPDLSPLATDFDLSGQASRRKMQVGIGGVSSSTSHEVNLTPRRAGVLTIPSLRVGRERTLALPLVVSAAAAPARSDSTVFLETEFDDPSPYVQQSVGITVRLHYAVPLASGQLDLDAPEGASLQRAGEDVQSNREFNGRRYNVVERRFVMIPERSGPLSVPGARFAGRGVGGWMDDFLGNSVRELSARNAARVLQVRPQPASAPQPWLPLHDLRLRYVEAPRQLRAGEAATVVVEAVAKGATRTQMPELAAPSVRGAQVFAEPAQFEESFVDGSPQVKLTRRYSIVPGAAGRLVVPGPSLAWWDVSADRARASELPDLALEVQPGSGGFAGPAMPADPVSAIDAAVDAAPVPPGGAGGRIWTWLAVAFALLWLVTLAWALGRRAPPAQVVGTERPVASAHAQATHSMADLRRALDQGSLDEVGDVLRGMAVPPAGDLDLLETRLSVDEQRDALRQLRRARWADGDGVAARAALRAAFAKGPRWKDSRVPSEQILPPLYPQR